MGQRQTNPSHLTGQLTVARYHVDPVAVADAIVRRSAADTSALAA